MTGKLTLIEQLGETGLLLPELVNRGLAANDRIKYYLTLLQAAKAHADQPEAARSDLRPEREASGVDDATLDETVAASRYERPEAVWIPNAQKLQAELLAGVRAMLQPVLASDAAMNPARSYVERLEAIEASLAPCPGDVMPAAQIDALTHAAAEGPDSVHRLVMELHRELNHLQSTIARESIDGASVYGLADEDRPLVQAFMRGVNATAHLKFDHPGLATTATRSGPRLSIQNDIGTTDAHVIVIHVEQLTVTLVYTDIHRARTAFLRDLLSPYEVHWSAGGAPAGAGYEMTVGRLVAADAPALERYLAFVGSRLVFLIDWNRARKRLQRLVKKSDAVAVLRWAADNNVGHRAFLQAGDTRLVATALERTRAQFRYGVRLDELLGREGAQAFLKAALRLESEGTTAGRSQRLIQDEIEAELLGYLQTTEHGAVGMAAEHATYITAIADRLEQAIARAGRDGSDDYLRRTAELAKRWETKADQIVKHSRRALDQGPSEGAPVQLVVAADDVADALEEVAFFLTMLPRPAPPAIVDVLRSLADLLARGARQYVRLLEIAGDQAYGTDRSVLDTLLVTVDELVQLEHDTDTAERHAQVVAVQRADDFRELHVVSSIAGAFEEAADGLARCALIVRDRVLGAMAGRP